MDTQSYHSIDEQEGGNFRFGTGRKRIQNTFNRARDGFTQARQKVRIDNIKQRQERHERKEIYRKERRSRENTRSDERRALQEGKLEIQLERQRNFVPREQLRSQNKSSRQQPNQSNLDCKSVIRDYQMCLQEGGRSSYYDKYMKYKNKYIALKYDNN